MEEGIAVVGMGCNFPGGEGLESFWKVLLDGQNRVADIPSERFDTSFWCDADATKPGKTQTSRAALIDGFNEFDHKFFGISEAEAEVMDPQQKLLLQCSYRALEDAGIPTESFSGTRTGVYIGLMNRDYEMLRNNNPNIISHYNGTGTATSVAANRISFTFNLTGPSFVIDSACSSSLVALHVACQALQQGDCEMALCGGVNCIIEPRVFVALSKAKMISPEGTSKPFSIRADGYGRGEGCGVLLLKPLGSAKRDHNRIWGIISKTAVNQDGRSVTPITKPSKVQQAELLRGIYSEIDNVQYIEAHGTGTPAGDTTEAGSISEAVAEARAAGSKPVMVGSLKGNIGHTESAAGVAGIMKVLLMMKHETIVPTVFYSDDSASVDVKALKLHVPSKAERWEAAGPHGRVAGVNSFGFGGTNAHAVLKEYNNEEAPPKTGLKLCVLSAASEKSLILTITDTYRRLSQTVDLQALAYTSACGRSHLRHKYRKAFAASSLPDLQNQLKAAVKAKVEPVRSDTRVVFVFCGNGVSYKGMCRQLMRDVPAFREKVREVERIFHQHETISISKQLCGEDCDFNRPGVVQPLLFALQVGLACLLKSWGVKPDSVLGHSIGEVAAAHCSGLLSLEDAVKVVYHRSALQSKVTGGKMLVVGNVEVDQVLEVLAEFSGKVCVAAFNSPRSCTLSGDADAVDGLHERLKLTFTDKNLFLCVLDVPAAYHSHLMEPVLEDIERRIGSLHANNMECKLLSTVTGQKCSDGDFLSGTYWRKNIREPVYFEKALRAAVRESQSGGNLIFVEVGPRRSLQRYIHETLRGDTTVLSVVRPGKDLEAISLAMARLFELGVNVDWNQFYKGDEMLPTSFPVYQFDNSKNNVNFEALRNDNGLAISHHPFLTRINQNNKEFTFNLSLDVAPYLWEHKNNGVPIVPGSFYVELALASVMESLQSRSPVPPVSLSLTFQSVLTLTSKSQQLKVTLQHSGTETLFKIQSSVATHASGTCSHTKEKLVLEEPSICPDVIYRRCKVVMTKQEVYSVLSEAGFEYGPPFQHLNDVQFGNELKEAVTTLQVPGEVLGHLHECFLHPVVLDYFMQMTAVVAMEQLGVKQGFPSGIASMVMSGPLQEKMVMYSRVTHQAPEFLDVWGCFSTTDGKVLVELKGVRISFLDSSVPQSLLFHNETVALGLETDLENCEMKAIVFEDKLSIANRLKPYLSPESVFVESKENLTADQVRDLVLDALHSNEALTDVLFLWGVEDLTHLSAETMLQSLVTCCEFFRQIVLAVKESKRRCSLRVITHRSTETAVDHVSAGFVLSGLTRACAAELSDLSFQLVDLAFVTSEDVQMLACVIRSCKHQEVRISNGQIWGSRITQTQVKVEDFSQSDAPFDHLEDFVLQTNDPYRVANLSAIPADKQTNPVLEKSIEVKLTRVCVHSSDYFPVSTSHSDFGETVYWSKHGSQRHKLLALDFSGIVTAVGKDAHRFRVGDHIASCYAVEATTTVVVPEAACYRTKTLPFLRETPCVSFFILAWEILQKRLSEVKNHRRQLVVVSSNSASALVKVLALTASRSGWNVSSWSHVSRKPQRCGAVVFLPPFDPSWEEVCGGDDHVVHAVFVCSTHMASRMFALKKEHILVHKVDVANVLQRSNLREQNENISKWLSSLGFDEVSLPLRMELHQVGESESYFTTTKVQQVVLNYGSTNCPPSDVPLLKKPEKIFKKSAVYIVTGGISGLGLETVKFIACNGGGCIATLSRRSLSEERQFEMNLLEKRYGVSILNIQCDVSSLVQVVNAISEILQRFPSCPITGVFHSAAVLHDALIQSLDEDLFRKVLQPKVSGVLNLHYATLHNKLDFFVCYSSISSFIGNASQCNYAAANSFLDAFCHYRRNRGLAGQSINWGPLNVGLLLNKEHFQRFLEAKGMMVMSLNEIHQTLRMCLIMNRPQQVICKFNYRNLHDHVLSQNASLRERLSALVAAELKGGGEPRVQPLSSTRQRLRTVVSEMLNMRAEELEDKASLCVLGVDSMLAMTLQNKIFQETGVNVPLVIILDPSSTLVSLEKFVLSSG